MWHSDAWILVAHVSLSLAYGSLVGRVLLPSDVATRVKWLGAVAAVVFWLMFFVIPFFYVPVILGMAARVWRPAASEERKSPARRESRLDGRRVVALLLLALALLTALALISLPSMLT